MAKKKVKVLNAVVDGHTKGEVIEIDSKSADMLVARGYVELVNKTEDKKVEDKKVDDKKEDGK